MTRRNRQSTVAVTLSTTSALVALTLLGGCYAESGREDEEAIARRQDALQLTVARPADSVVAPSLALGANAIAKPVLREELASAIRIPTLPGPAPFVCPPPPGTRPDPTLVNTDPFVLKRFPLKRVYEQLVLLSAAGAPGPVDLYRQMWDALAPSPGFFPSAPHCDDAMPPGINGFPIDCPRPEAVLRNTQPDAFLPVALFNRFDLAPADGSHCGEYRIIYAANGRFGREFIIFEGIVPNPKPSCGLEACRPVAKFWDQLASFNPAVNADQIALADALEAFYFTGLPGFEPVVHPDHYGSTGSGGYGNGKGQIRVNLFGGAQWQLREFVLRSPCRTGACPLELQPVTVKNNPFFDLFDVTSALPRALQFQATFPASVPSLASATVNQISMATADRFNAGQSNSSAFAERYETQLGGPSAFTAAIDAANPDPGLTAHDIATRATTQSCGGCHQNSNNQNLGNGLVWPPSLGFVHVDEASQLSEALWCSFLPARKQVLDAFVTSPPMLCPPLTILSTQLQARPTFVLDPELEIRSLPEVDPSLLTISGKLAGPN